MDFSRNHAAVMLISQNGGSTGVSLFRQRCLICSVFSRIMLIDLLRPCLSPCSVICLILSSRFLVLAVATRQTWSVSLNILDRSWWIPGLPPDNPMLFLFFSFLLIPWLFVVAGLILLFLLSQGDPRDSWWAVLGPSILWIRPPLLPLTLTEGVFTASITKTVLEHFVSSAPSAALGPCCNLFEL